MSTKAQAESGAGLEHQRRECERYIQAQGWQLVEVIADEGASGTKAPDSRPGLGRALKMLDEGDADALVSLKVDRVSRSTLDFATLVKRSDDQGWQLHTLDVPLDPATPIGKAMRNMLATFAQLERDFISARTREGLAIKMEQPDFQIGRRRAPTPRSSAASAPCGPAACRGRRSRPRSPTMACPPRRARAAPGTR